MKEQEIPKPIQDALEKVATNYSQSPHTTNAGKILRIIAGLIPVSTIVKIFAYKLSR